MYTEKEREREWTFVWCPSGWEQSLHLHSIESPDIEAQQAEFTEIPRTHLDPWAP